MDCFLLQDWLNVHQTSGTMTQSESGWLDLASYRDVVVWLEVKQVTSTSITIAVETAVAKEESLFAAMAATPGAITGGVVYVTPVLQDVQTGAAGAAALARWVRWKITFTGTVDVTFRIWIAANKPGRAARDRRSHEQTR